MKKYLSETFTEEFMDGLTNEVNYLIGAECSAGKTTAIFVKLVEYAKSRDKKVLFVCNRTALKEQVLNKYFSNKEKESIYYENDNVKLIMYQSITTLKKLKLDWYEEDFDYVIIDEAHLIYDASDYDINPWLFCDYLNHQQSVVIFLSGTPSSVEKLDKYLTKGIKKIKDVDKNTNKVNKVFLFEDKDLFVEQINNYLSKDYKMLYLVSRTKDIIGIKNKLSFYKIACAVSPYNQHKDFLMFDYDKYVYKNIIENEKLESTGLIATKFLDVGININADRNFVICFECYEMPNTIEQFVARIRFPSDSPFHVDIVFLLKKPHYKYIKKSKDDLSQIYNLYNNDSELKNLLNNDEYFNIKFGGFGWRSLREKIICLEEYNPIKKSFLEDKIHYYELITSNDSALEYYIGMFKDRYPLADVKTYLSVSLKEIIQCYIKDGNEKIFLNKEEIISLRTNINRLGLFPKYNKELPALKRINNVLKANNLSIEFKTWTKTINKESKRGWLLIKK